ncbi:hypothetical protein MMC26_007405 [Xylographa opegraphella]|nr:hypothetical protein [Xylographa opegraphella]
MDILSNSSSSSNRVKVEYTDPSGIYPLVASELESRLPLRNLHWNSSSRPLRSIDSLYVELGPDEYSVPQSQKRAASSAGLPGAYEAGIAVRESSDLRRGSEPSISKKERRHQIPGLRQTSYLKLFFLRCDDSETYKGSSRKVLREWIKTHTPPSQNSTSVNSQENHDAFEWMIVHVVLPDVQNNSIWPNRASLSVLDKIRADFNGSTKSAIDRVAQIPATKSLQVQGITVNPIPSGAARDQFLRESNRAWEDLLSKVKALILTSFDLRVRQYEEDIKAKSAQRSLPGWNFCTFFVLKEGLSRGFESVGLVEDALMGYDELAVELYTAIEDERQKSSTGEEATLFRGYTQELRDQAEHAMAIAREAFVDSKNVQVSTTLLLDTERKPYRELILANNISAFEFESYVFARQISLLSRIARLPPTAGSTTGDSQHLIQLSYASSDSILGGRDQDDMIVLAEMVRRSLKFITSAGRSIREDLRASIQSQEDAEEAHLALRYNVFENLVASWTYGSCQQILPGTAPASLMLQLESTMQNPLNSPASPPSRNVKQNISKGRPSALARPPTRTSSLLSHPPSNNSSPSYDGFTEDVTHPQPSPLQNETQTGLYVLAAQRAELFIVARRALTSMGRRQGWDIVWPDSTGDIAEQDENMDEISLNDTPRTRQDATSTGIAAPSIRSSTKSGIHSSILSGVLVSRLNFLNAYEDITATACRHYKLSDDRSILEDYTAAIVHFQQLASFYAENDWSELEISILDICAKCFKKLGRRDDYIAIVLKMLTAIVQRSRHLPRLKIPVGLDGSGSVRSQNAIDASTYLKDLLHASKSQDEPVSAAMRNYFSDIRLDSSLIHFGSKDGFQIPLSLQYLLPAPLEILKIEARVISATEGQTREIWLSSEETMKVDKGLLTTFLVSNTMVPDWYLLDQITVQVDNLLFTHRIPPADGSKFFAGSRTSTSSDGLVAPGARIFVWPRQGSLEVRASLYPHIHLDESRSVMCEISSGDNTISGGMLLVRAASGGLRLHTANAELMDAGGRTLDRSQAGNICFEGIPAHTSIKIRIPYRLDNEMREIGLRTEVRYTTADGTFVYGDSHTLPVLLPLGVNVHDVFKQHALFSKFSISTSTSVPLRLLKCQIEGSEDFEASSPRMPTADICVFPRQPASMVCKITPKRRIGRGTDTLQTRLSMRIQYLCLDEEILAAILARFSDALRNSDFEDLSRPLRQWLSTNIRTTLAQENLELMGLLREVEMSVFQNFHWEQIVTALPLGRQGQLLPWLSRWSQDNAVIEIPQTFDEGQGRTITIPVDVPHTHVVHTARLRMLAGAHELDGASGSVAVGHCIPAQLELQHSRRWQVRTEAGSGPEPGQLEFHYELDASPESWLIGGRRKAQFSARVSRMRKGSRGGGRGWLTRERQEDEVLTFPVLLIPQRAGHLPYPSLDIQGFERPPEAIGVTGEVDYRSHGRSVLVVANRGSTTVGVEPEAGGRGAWLMDAQRRAEAVSG